MSLSLSQRQENAREHANMLAELLARPAVKGMAQRIFRARVWFEMIPADIITEAHHDYLVMTLVQSPLASRLKIFVTRPFTQAIGPAPSAAQMELSGAYSVDEIVAFLTLDRVPPEQVEWRDETGSDIVPAADILGKLYQG